MATRTAPDASLIAPNKVITTLHFIDASGDLYASSVVSTFSITDAQIQGIANAYQSVTQASLYKVSQTREWLGDADPDNADVGQRNSVKSGINLLWKNTSSLNSQSVRVIAPVATVMQGNQDIPLLSDADMTALIVALQDPLTGYDLVSAQYTERRERSNNPRIKA